ncbi:MAG TPA: hypothetical protein VGM39_00025 [Kofleriaceae bacterium]|jgi:hypothetical protein
MRFWTVGILSLAACSTSDATEPPTVDATPHAVTIDAVVSSDSIAIVIRGDKDGGECTYFSDFPQPGECGILRDNAGCDRGTTSCDTSVRFRGTVMSRVGLDADYVDTYDGTGGLLEVDACGSHWSLTVPPGPYGAAPSPTAAFSEDGSQFAVSTSWPAVADAASYLVSFYFGTVGQVCHVTEPHHVFDSTVFGVRPTADNIYYVDVQAFEPVISDEEANGTLRVWAGNWVRIPVQGATNQMH